MCTALFPPLTEGGPPPARQPLTREQIIDLEERRSAVINLEQANGTITDLIRRHNLIISLHMNSISPERIRVEQLALDRIRQENPWIELARRPTRPTVIELVTLTATLALGALVGSTQKMSLSTTYITIASLALAHLVTQLTVTYVISTQTRFVIHMGFTGAMIGLLAGSVTRAVASVAITVLRGLGKQAVLTFTG